MTDRKIMEQALADLKIAEVDGNCNYGATELLRNRLAQPEQEPIKNTTVEDNSQEWRGMDGATAWHLIDRHADGWADVGKMMGEWLASNQTQPAPLPEQEPSGWKLVPLKPTQEMLRSIEAGTVSYLAFCWKAMLSAAPTPPQRKPLTDEQYFEIGQRHGLSSFKVEQIHKEIEEDAHGIKGGHDD